MGGSKAVGIHLGNLSEGFVGKETTGAFGYNRHRRVVPPQAGIAPDDGIAEESDFLDWGKGGSPEGDGSFGWFSGQKYKRESPGQFFYFGVGGGVIEKDDWIFTKEALCLAVEMNFEIVSQMQSEGVFLGFGDRSQGWAGQVVVRYQAGDFGIRHRTPFSLHDALPKMVKGQGAGEVGVGFGDMAWSLFHGWE